MIYRWVTLLALIGVLAGCVTETVKTTSVPTLATYETELADDEILDIAIAVFDPGIAEAQALAHRVVTRALAMLPVVTYRYPA